jgi:thioredoxin-like negative regulator of GroEL
MRGRRALDTEVRALPGNGVGEAAVAGALQSVTDEFFETDVLDRQGGVLVDIWAEWCRPCRLMAPELRP